jgi:hypothetical protein
LDSCNKYAAAKSLWNDSSSNLGGTGVMVEGYFIQCPNGAQENPSEESVRHGEYAGTSQDSFELCLIKAIFG